MTARVLPFRRPMRALPRAVETDEGVSAEAHPGAVRLVFANGTELWFSPATIHALHTLSFTAAALGRERV